MTGRNYKETLRHISELATNPEVKRLALELADRLEREFNHTDTTAATVIGDVQYNLTGAIEAIQKDVAELRETFYKRQLHVEQRVDEYTEVVSDKVHTLSNRFMAIEDKLNELAKLFDEVLQQVLTDTAAPADEAPEASGDA